MAFTEIRNINGKKYYYRVVSIRNGEKISKKRVYLGKGLTDSEIIKKEKEADKKMLVEKTKPNKEIEKIKSKIIKVLKKNKVSKAGIFGSYSRGEQNKNSDIDIVVEINDSNMSLFGFIRLSRLLEELLKSKDKDKFSKDILRQSAIIRQLEIIGGAAKNISGSFREKYPNIAWKDIAGVRDVLSHAYFGVNLDRIWQVSFYYFPNSI